MIPGRPFSTASYESVGVVTPKSPIEGKDGIICMRHTYKRRRREGRTLIPDWRAENEHKALKTRLRKAVPCGYDVSYSLELKLMRSHSAIWQFFLELGYLPLTRDVTAAYRSKARISIFKLLLGRKDRQIFEISLEMASWQRQIVRSLPQSPIDCLKTHTMHTFFLRYPTEESHTLLSKSKSTLPTKLARPPILHRPIQLLATASLLPSTCNTLQERKRERTRRSQSQSLNRFLAVLLRSWLLLTFQSLASLVSCPEPLV